MKRVITLALASALAAGATAFAAAGSGSATRPFLRIVDTTPVTVRGTNFEPAEAITVTALLRPSGQPAEHQTRSMRAGTAGGFTATLPSLESEGCAIIAVTATGASGDRASAKVIPECAARVTG